MAIFGIGCFEGFIAFMALGVGLMALLVKHSTEKNKASAYERDKKGLPPIQTPSVAGQVAGAAAGAAVKVMLNGIANSIKK